VAISHAKGSIVPSITLNPERYGWQSFFCPES
jgi:hypothetical protein